MVRKKITEQIIQRIVRKVIYEQMDNISQEVIDCFKEKGKIELNTENQKNFPACLSLFKEITNPTGETTKVDVKSLNLESKCNEELEKNKSQATGINIYSCVMFKTKRKNKNLNV
jgi:hypothetical protein